MRLNKLFVLAALTLCTPFALVSCGSTTANRDTVTSPRETIATTAASPSPDDSPKAENELTAVTGSPTGNYYKAANELNEILKEGGKFSLAVEESEGSIDNLKKIAGGEAELGFTQIDAYAYQTYTDEKEGTKISDKVAVFAPVSNEIVHIVVNKKAGIKSIADLKDKKVAIGAKNSGTSVSALLIYFANQLLDPDNPDTKNLTVEATDESLKKVMSGELDAVFFTAAEGVPLLKEVSAEEGKDLELLAVKDDSFIKTNELEGVYTSYNLPANTYPWQAEEVPVISTYSFVVVSKDLDQEEVYEMAKLVYGKSGELESKNPFWKLLKVKEAKSDVKSARGINYHPGVVKFLEEQ